MKPLSVFLACLALSLIAVQPSKADVSPAATVTPSESGWTADEQAFDGDITYNYTHGDLIAGNSSTLASDSEGLTTLDNTNPFAANGIAQLIDGTADSYYVTHFGGTPPGGTNQFSGDAYFAGTAVVTFDLNIAANPNGYTINKIQTMAGYYAETFINQDYSVWVQTTTDANWQQVGGPGNFVNDTNTGNFGYTGGGAEEDDSTETTITDSTGILATNVTEIQFRYANDGTTNLRELDVLGEATAAGVPEPTTWAMLLGGLGFLGFWLRRRKA